MNYFIIETEAKIFCLSIIILLWFFQYKNPQAQWSKLRYVYLFSAVGGVLSVGHGIAKAFADDSPVYSLLGIAFGACYAITVYFWAEYAFALKKAVPTVIIRILMLTGAVILGAFSYYSLKHESNSAFYLTTLAMTVVFVASQYNKIKIDNLTKLYNRYGMDEEIREQLQQYEHDRNNSFYIIACDLDNFKYINDTWGHQEGDRALILIATALSKVAKMFNAEVFRIGGDEFVIITDTSEEGLATEITEAVKDELDNIDFRNDFDIKMSMGVALYDGAARIDELLNNADKKLYQAKRNSKNG